MTTPVNVGIFAPVVAQPDKILELESFLRSGYDLSLIEADTIQWYALKFFENKERTYAIFDTFHGPEGRREHLAGPIAQALMANAPILLSSPPEINEIEILASIVDLKKGAGGVGSTAGLSVGLNVQFEAKPDKVEAVKDFLVSARSLVLEEAETPVWYAIHFGGTNKFGIIDFFGSEGGRNAHLGGKVAAALFGSAEELLTATPSVDKVDVIAAKA